MTTLKENNAELENNIANWERHLFELNQWVDDEREAKEKLHVSVVFIFTVVMFRVVTFLL